MAYNLPGEKGWRLVHTKCSSLRHLFPCGAHTLGRTLQASSRRTGPIIWHVPPEQQPWHNLYQIAQYPTAYKAYNAQSNDGSSGTTLKPGIDERRLAHASGGKACD